MDRQAGGRMRERTGERADGRAGRRACGGRAVVNDAQVSEHFSVTTGPIQIDVNYNAHRWAGGAAADAWLISVRVGQWACRSVGV